MVDNKQQIDRLQKMGDDLKTVLISAFCNTKLSNNSAIKLSYFLWIQVYIFPFLSDKHLSYGKNKRDKAFGENTLSRYEKGRFLTKFI